MWYRLCFAVSLLTTLCATSSVAETSRTIDLNGVRGQVRVMSLQELRQTGLMRQGWDSSCGAAALGTVLNYYYRRNFSELTIVLTLLKNGDANQVRAQGGFSLLDLKRFVQAVGYQGKGYDQLTVDDLVAFKVPVILPVSIRGFDHFLVFRSRLADRVLLSDPAFGNLTMTVQRFQEMWPSRIGFVVLPGDRSVPMADEPIEPPFMSLPIPDLQTVSRLIEQTPIIPMTRRPPVAAQSGQ
jgi:predicted double-glycine peptidase